MPKELQTRRHVITPRRLPLALYVAVLSAISLATTFATPETRGRDLDDLRDAGQEPAAAI